MNCDGVWYLTATCLVIKMCVCVCVCVCVAGPLVLAAKASGGSSKKVYYSYFENSIVGLNILFSP